MISLDSAQLGQLALAFLTLANTVLLILNRKHVEEVKVAANGAQAQALKAAELAGFSRGAGTEPPAAPP